ncbi:hypothetical protein HYDPIDRAFT_107274 [Hydnomerulius pinastri MD-312]|nr:hypothetical protein HYDPIDRAFT_107274 [Hydnomerulius pinastri MD-312]
MDSRSSSPETPETSDGPHNVVIHNELPSWFHALRPGKNISVIGVWDGESPLGVLEKPEDERMLQLDDLIEEHAYDDSACSSIDASPLFSQTMTDALHSESAAPPDPIRPSPQTSPQESEYCVPPQSQMRCSPVVPPPAARPRKRDPNSAPHRVVHPPRESCYNLAILTPSIPENGTKSRVETQVRVIVDLAHASSSSGEQQQYDRVGSWKWLQLPPGTSTKKRTRREGKIDPAPLDILHLTTTVTCASAPHNRVLSCGSCRNREAKRVARKVAARVRPARSDSDTPEDGTERQRGIKEDTTSIIQFNCPEVLDFSTGSAVLPVRITCYCRHHREKVGFHVHFTMMDHTGRVVGTGTTPPIMITDDHKSTVKSGGVAFNPLVEGEVDWSKLPQAGDSVDKGAPSKRKLGNTNGQPKKRAKPYDSASRSNSVKFSREASVASLSSSLNSPSTQPSTVPNTRSPTPSQLPQPLTSLASDIAPAPPLPIFAADGDPFGSSGPIDPSLLNATAIFASANGMTTVSADQLLSSSDTLSSPIAAPAPQPSQLLSTLVPPQPMPFMFFNPGSPPPITSLPMPKIHRLIPASGPTHGGIEVTILGENFHPAIQFNCVFGDVAASSTQRWSDNTLLCVLPPRSAPGVVAVWFEGFDKSSDPTLPSLFTYTDESDRALMELALQVVGLKMTGKIEDAKNVALRIVGTTGTEDSPSQTNSSADDMMQVASSSYHDIRPLLFIRSGERGNFETAILKFLSIVDVSVEKQSNISMAAAISHATSSGQTLLHLAVFLKFATLTEFLITHNIDLDARDRNGYTALHFAVLVRSKECAKLLADAGADPEIVNVLGKTPHDIAPVDFFEDIVERRVSSDSEVQEDREDDDGESHWGDIETDEDSEAVVIKRKHVPRVIRRRSNHRTHDVDEESRVSETSPPSHAKDTSTKTEDIKAPIPGGDSPDEKQAASFVDLIQRTFAQLQAPQGIISNMPQLPLPHLPEMPAVPWNALPQIPMVFPVFVPMPGWPSFLSDKREGQQEDEADIKDAQPAGYSAARTAQELRATWEKWMALAVATATLRPPPADEAPPMYTPRETQEESATQQPVASTSQVQSEEVDPEGTTRSSSALDRSNRRVGYEDASVPAQDVDAYGYVPINAHTQIARQKNDRMLVLFWLPILLLSLLWAFHNGIRFAFHALKTTLSLKVGVRA